MHRFKLFLSSLAIVAACAAGGSAAAATYNVTFAGGHATHLPWMKAIKEFYIPEVDKRLAGMGGQHKIVWNQAFGGTVAKVRGVLEAVQEGVTEMGMVYTIFEPAKLPLLAVTFMAPFGTDDVPLVSRILVEMNDEMEALRAEWGKHNQVFLGAVAADTDHIWTKFPVTSIASLTRTKRGRA